MTRPAPQGSPGFGLTLAVIALALTGLLAAAVVSELRALLRDSLYQSRLIEAQAAAESGVEAALARLGREGGWRDGFKEKPWAGGWCDVSLTTSPVTTIVSTGWSRRLAAFGRAHRSVRLRAAVLPIPQLRYGAQTDEGLFMAAGAAVDRYDSEFGTEPAQFDRTADVWSNRGPGSNPRPQDQNLRFDPEDGAPFVEDNDNRSIDPAFYDASSRTLTVPAGAAASLGSGVYSLRGLSVEGALRIEPSSGPVVLFLDGPLSVTGELLNESKVPADFIVYGRGEGEDWTFSGRGDLHGVFHAPTRDVVSSQTLYGAVVGKRVSLMKGTLHYDRSLQRPRSYAVRVLPKTWRAGF